MPNQSLLRSLEFTKSVGNRFDDDKKFNDASEVGGFPYEQRITRILKIELYSQDAIPFERAIINGLAVTYMVEGSPDSPMPTIVIVKHGVVNREPIGTVNLKDNEILVGASGRLKYLPEDPLLNTRLSCIAFYVFNKDTGLATVEGPFGSKANVRQSWGSFGPIIAFQGTVNGSVGLMSLGFAKLIQGVPEMGIADK